MLADDFFHIFLLEAEREEILHHEPILVLLNLGLLAFKIVIIIGAGAIVQW